VCVVCDWNMHMRSVGVQMEVAPRCACGIAP
jgi:hypothetical protein